jgi:hypothetical protein
VWTINDIEEQKKIVEDTHAQWGAPTGTPKQTILFANITCDIFTEVGSNRGGIHTINNTFMDPVRIGKEALEHTNAFRFATNDNVLHDLIELDRKQHKLPPLKWHQTLCDIGVKHSTGKEHFNFFSAIVCILPSFFRHGRW